MNNDPFLNDEPTQPLGPHPPSNQDQQGKLIIGGFQNAPKRSERRPYQYPPQPQQRAEQPPVYPQRQPELPGMSTPAVDPRTGRPSPFNQPGQIASSPTPQGKQRSPRRRTGCLVGCLIVVVLLCVLGGLTATTAQRVLAFGSAISTQSPLSTQTGYMGTSDRVNLLVMGYGGGNHQGANLTDSIVVMSLLPQSHHTTLISVPRDLWVQVPEGSGQYAKINTVYEFASNNGATPATGGDAAAQKVSLVTGLDVKYWLTINFQGFRDFINAIGGIDVYVPDSFTAKYPKNDDPSVNPNWKIIHFSKGMHHMDGETAIEYARARYVLDNPAEGTDFARSARQQIMIKAALSKVKQISTWPSLYNALTALEHTIYTNLSLADLIQFSLKMDLNDAHRVGLSNQNVLVGATSNDGQAILLPMNNNWQAIKDYVKQQLYN